MLINDIDLRFSFLMVFLPGGDREDTLVIKPALSSLLSGRFFMKREGPARWLSARVARETAGPRLLEWKPWHRPASKLRHGSPVPAGPCGLTAALGSIFGSYTSLDVF